MAFQKRLMELQVWLDGNTQLLKYDGYIMAGLLILSVIGVALTDAFELFSHVYWLAMVPVFFGACLFVEWKAARKSGTPVAKLIINQALHWLGLLVAVNLVYLLRNMGSLDNATTGLSLLLVFALGTYLAGVATGVLFQLLGIFLALSLVMVAYTEHYIWVTIGFALAILIIYGVILRQIERKHRDADESGV